MTTTLPFMHTWITIGEAAARLGLSEREMTMIVRAAAFDTICDMWTGERRVRLADIKMIEAANKEAE